MKRLGENGAPFAPGASDEIIILTGLTTQDGPSSCIRIDAREIAGVEEFFRNGRYIGTRYQVRLKGGEEWDMFLSQTDAARLYDGWYRAKGARELTEHEMAEWEAELARVEREEEEARWRAAQP